MIASQEEMTADPQRTIAELRRQLDEHRLERDAGLAREAALAEVLDVINRSPSDLAPVFDAMLDMAMRLCAAACGGLFTYDGERFHTVAARGVPAAMAEFRGKNPPTVRLGGHVKRLLETRRPVHVLDWMEEETYRNGDIDARAIVDLGGARTNILVPLLKEETVVGFFGLYRQEVRTFTDKQIALLQSFAAQAVIAMENARLLGELQQRNVDLQESLEYQIATSDVLKVINASAGDLERVFDTVLEKAVTLCESSFGVLVTYDGECFHTAAMREVAPGLADAIREPVRPSPGMAYDRIVQGADIVHIADITGDDVYRSGNRIRRALADQGGARTALFVALRKDEALFGVFVIYRKQVRPFSDRQIALLNNFAAQAVIAIENARLLGELQERTDELAQRQAQLRVTFENMGDGVAMFDEAPRLVAWNRKFQEIFNVPGGLLEERRTYAEYIRYLAARGDYGPGTDVEGQVRLITANTDQRRTYERNRPDGRVVEIRNNPVMGGGFVLIFSDITERKQSEAKIRAARDAAEEARRTIEAAFRDLKTAQANLIQAEKMASLGQLTAGIAHEIKNPLNFVNNFSALSAELIDELRDVLAPEPLGETARTEVDDLTVLLKGNLERVVQHGQRADGIIRSMLDHSRGSSGERRMVDLNALIDEALNLAYHGARAQDQTFNITLERDFGEGIAPIEVNPQDMTRVFLNIFSNGFYAATRRARSGEDSAFMPMLQVTTRDAGEAVEIRVRHNGIGIPTDIRDKLFQPFFTTKLTGEGTGLGLSITYDIVTQQHDGTIAVESEVGDYCEFTIRLPRNP
jgi:signal transduction histidine kinase/GAF domain-containing protein